MSHNKHDRLWKIQDGWGKLEIYVSDYAFPPKKDQLRCDVLVKTENFSGEYQTLLQWQQVAQFAAECTQLASAGAVASASENSAVFDNGDGALHIAASPVSERKVRWEMACQPVPAHAVQKFHLTATTEGQLLNSIQTGANRLWKRLPGPGLQSPWSAAP